MTEPTAPSSAPVGRDGFAQLLHAEWTKFRTVRGWVIGMVVAAVVTVLLGLFAASSSGSLLQRPGEVECPRSRWGRAARRCATGSTSCTSRWPATAASPSG